MSLLSRASAAGRAMARGVVTAGVAAVGTPELQDRLGALLSISAYQRPHFQQHPALNDEQTKRLRSALGGNLYPLPTTRTRWFIKDLELAQQQADYGWLQMIAQLSRSMRRDGTLYGLLNARMAGTVSLPKVWRGNSEIISVLRGRGGARSVFDEMFPRAELGAMAIDEFFAGVAIGEMLPVEGRDYPVLCRLDPEWLQYRWMENQWYYHSVEGVLPVVPGDGRWILHIGGSRLQPWTWGHWHACGWTWINKVHAQLHEANWEAKLAHPLRVAEAPQGASEGNRQSWAQAALAWAMNTVVAALPGYSIKLVESNGRGYESFLQTIDRSDREFMIEVLGNVVSTTGGSGFNMTDLFKQVRHDLKVQTADALSDTLNTQGIPPWVYDRWGEEGLEDYPTFRYDVREAKDLTSEATAFTALAGAVRALSESLAPFGLRLDVKELLGRFGVPVEGDFDEDGIPEIEGETTSERARFFFADVRLIQTAIDMGKKEGLAPTKESIKSILASLGIETEDAPVTVAAPADGDSQKAETAPAAPAPPIREAA